MEARCDSFDHVSAGVVVLCTSLSQPISSTAARKTRFANRGQYADQIHIKVECYRLCNSRRVIILSCDFGYPGWSVRVDLELSRTAYLSLPYLCLGTGAVWTLIHTAALARWGSVAHNLGTVSTVLGWPIELLRSGKPLKRFDTSDPALTPG